MAHVRRLGWPALLLPGTLLVTGRTGPALTSLLTILFVMGFLVRVDWRDARNAAAWAARQEH